jgi:hypothetical protein
MHASSVEKRGDRGNEGQLSGKYVPMRQFSTRLRKLNRIEIMKWYDHMDEL